MTPKQFRKLRGNYTLSELSEIIGVTTRTIRRYEDGTREISKPIQLLMVYVYTGLMFDPCDEVISVLLDEI